MSEKSNESLLLRGAFVPTLIVSLVAIAASTVVKGASGFWGALLAQFVVIIFFVIHIAVSRMKVAAFFRLVSAAKKSFKRPSLSKANRSRARTRRRMPPQTSGIPCRPPARYRFGPQPCGRSSVVRGGAGLACTGPLMENGVISDQDRFTQPIFSAWTCIW